MRVLICGGRDYTNYRHFATVMCDQQKEFGTFTVIIHGGAKGADWCAHLFAGNGRQELTYRAEWEKYGSSAGPIRNQQMIDEGRPELVIAFPGGRGTADMVRRAKTAGIELVEVK